MPPKWHTVSRECLLGGEVLRTNLRQTVRPTFPSTFADRSGLLARPFVASLSSLCVVIAFPKQKIVGVAPSADSFRHPLRSRLESSIAHRICLCGLLDFDSHLQLETGGSSERSCCWASAARMSRRDDSYPRLVNREEEEEEGEWVADFCGCLADPPICLLTMFCPCIGAGMVIEKLDDGRTHCLAASLVWAVLQGLTACGCLYSCTYRRKLRNMYNLPSRPCPDSLTHLVCWPCAICQELRELKARETSYYGFGEDMRTSVIPPRRQIMDS